MKIIKIAGKALRAWELGAGSDMERQLIREGKIRREADGTYALFSREALDGQGQRAKAGDFFKVDGGGYPYPNRRSWFLSHHRRLEGDSYEQIPEPLTAWTAEEPMGPEIRFLLDAGRLKLDPAHPRQYFSAELWGAPLSAAKDAVVVFYRVKRAADGTVEDVEFNFVERSEFESTYRVLENEE